MKTASMQRLTLSTPRYDFNFDIKNGDLAQPFTWWQFTVPYNLLSFLHDNGVEGCCPKLNQILAITGPYARLWLDDLDGVIAPMEVTPQGWTYPCGDPLELQWWWQWHPSKSAIEKMLDFLNSSPFETMEKRSPFKFGIPFQLQRQLGEIQGVEAIPMMRLPNLIRSDVTWTFEWEKN